MKKGTRTLVSLLLLALTACGPAASDTQPTAHLEPSAVSTESVPEAASPSPEQTEYTSPAPLTEDENGMSLTPDPEATAAYCDILLNGGSFIDGYE